MILAPVNMWRRLLLRVIACGAAGGINARSEPDGSPLEIRAPFEPTAFPSSGHAYLTYDLTNIAATPIGLRRVEAKARITFA